MVCLWFKTTYCKWLELEGSPMDWSYVYKSLKSAEKLDLSVSPAEKTIASLDLQLYSKCIQLQSNLQIYSKKLAFAWESCMQCLLY